MHSSAPPPSDADLDLFADIIADDKPVRADPRHLAEAAPEAPRDAGPLPRPSQKTLSIGASVSFLTLQRGFYALTVEGLPAGGEERDNLRLPAVDIALLPFQDHAAVALTAPGVARTLHQQGDLILAKVQVETARFCIVTYHAPATPVAAEIAVERLA